jgi:MFS family permease
VDTVQKSGGEEFERATMRKVLFRLVPFLMVCYFFALLDRVNIGFAALQMNRDLGLTPAMFGFAASLFFVSYFLVEVPSNLALQRFGARKWIARIMITWGIVSGLMAFVIGPNSLYAMRFILGAAEAGFFPGAILYLTYWLPSEYRGRILATFTVSIPIATFIGSPLSVSMLELDGLLGLRGWQWMFIMEGIPTALLGVACLFVLTDRPAEAKWLNLEQRAWLTGRMEEEAARKKPIGHLSLWQLATNKYFITMAIVCSGQQASLLSIAISSAILATIQIEI